MTDWFSDGQQQQHHPISRCYNVIIDGEAAVPVPGPGGHRCAGLVDLLPLRCPQCLCHLGDRHLQVRIFKKNVYNIKLYNLKFFCSRKIRKNRCCILLAVLSAAHVGAKIGTVVPKLVAWTVVTVPLFPNCILYVTLGIISGTTATFMTLMVAVDRLIGALFPVW